jgi:hypothetical protein
MCIYNPVNFTINYDITSNILADTIIIFLILCHSKRLRSTKEFGLARILVTQNEALRHIRSTGK